MSEDKPRHSAPEEAGTAARDRSLEASAVLDVPAPQARPERNGPVRLDIGVGGPVLVEIVGPRRTYKTRFVGWEAGRYVLVSFPSRPEIRDQLYPDRALVLRFLHCDGTLYGFHTTVSAVLMKPERLLFLRWPEALETLSLRKENRVNCFLRARAARSDGSRVTGLILNISRHGCRLTLAQAQAAAAPAVGEVLTLGTRLFGCREDLDIRAAVRTLQAEEGRYTLGLEFENPPREAVDDIEGYVSEVQTTLGLACGI